MTSQSTPLQAAPNEAGQETLLAEALLSLCKASADQLRLDILRVLSRNSFGVLELCQILDYRQSALSHHLKLLAKAGLVTTRREGNTIFYRRAHQPSDKVLNDLHQGILAATDQLPLSGDVQTRLDAIHQDRAERSREFFAQNADKFSQQQEQIAAYELYAPNTAELVMNHVNRPATLLEVGPGEGAFLAELSPHFDTVYALDNSKQMLDKAQGFVDRQQLSNVHLIHGDTKEETLAHLDIDAIVANMVLHHTPSPAEIFSDLGSLLKPGGQLFITDLCRHDQTWVQEVCGDLWLGFEPEDISDWAANAGLNEGQSVYLTQRNGFRVQVRHFTK